MADSQPNLPSQEKEILAFWEKQEIFKKSLQKSAPKGNFVFFEGPPTANGRPGFHHAEARAFKDAIPRFRTMQGYHVGRKGGWDTHGLPVELEVEKQLGFKSKSEIEAYGIEAFNEKCRESVWKYLQEWIEFTKRMGYWVDLDNAYITYKPEYVESLWWCIKQIWDKGLLYKDYRVTPHCPRCGTSLSSHELSQGYKDVEDPAVTVAFKIIAHADGSAPQEPEYLVAWTTTPWTLPANVALAVGAQVDYVKVRQEGVYYWMAKARLAFVMSGDYEIVEECKGSALVGFTYEPLYPFVKEAIAGTPEGEKKAWRVVEADFVSIEDGSGIVHTAVMYGVEDFELGQKVGLPKYHLVDLNGKFTSFAGPYAGMFVKSADQAIMDDLASRGLLLKREKVTHTYPFCWRCKSPVIYYAKDSWYIRVSQLREKLIEENQKIHWEPEYLQEGRFGEWLREVKDWAFSRERYWGTPLPVWECTSCGKHTCVGSFEELRAKATTPVTQLFDPHRPFVDQVEVKCGSCGGMAKRVSDVIDVWFDSGAMPFAQGHYPFENKENIDKGQEYPADFISEAIDQTRGWFYTLLAVAVLLGKERPFKHVICLGHILDAEGKKMSKSLGNVVMPMDMMEKYGADAVRWYMYTINQPGEGKRFDEKALSEMVKKNFTILLNVVRFYEMFASKGGEAASMEPTHVMDRWILARLHALIRDNTQWLENYKVLEPARAISEFINDLSTWYVRRSRERCKGSVEESIPAVATLRTVLSNLSKLMAPFTPFIAETVYAAVDHTKESVHLEDWPMADETKIDTELLEEMGKARSAVSKALEKRAEAGINVRQVLSFMTLVRPSGTLSEVLSDVIKDEVNVKEIKVEKGEYRVDLDLTLTPELVREGTVREIIRHVNAMRKEAGLTIGDRIELFISSEHPEVQRALQEHHDALLKGTLARELRLQGEPPEGTEAFRVNEFDMIVGIVKK
jgi:isoleucyl-tRNA synthetase